MLMLLAFGNAKAQDTLKSAPKSGKMEFDSLARIEMSRLSEIMAALDTNMMLLHDSVDWEQFERDMEKFGRDMDKWAERMERWGERWERTYGDPGDQYEYDRPSPPNRPHKPEKPKSKGSKKKSLLLNPHWSGVDAGLNLMLGSGPNANLEPDYEYLELVPLRSWTFNFNIVDVGVAFSQSHVAGLYTGIGLGWNNYSFKNPVRLLKGEENLECEWLERPVKRSKLGVLYVQAPLMVEVRPTRKSFVALGVTGGIRIDTWTKIKFQDDTKEKEHSDYYVNLLKLDATLRAGGNNLGFFASYNLLPLFTKPQGPTTHILNVGFSLIF